MTSVTRLANHLLLVIGIAHHTHGGQQLAFTRRISGGQLDLCVILVLAITVAGSHRADDLATLPESAHAPNRGAAGILASGKGVAIPARRRAAVKCPSSIPLAAMM